MAAPEVRPRGEEVPRRGDGEEDRSGRERMQFEDAVKRVAQAAREDEVDRDDREREDDADEAFGEDSKRAAGSESVAEQVRNPMVDAPRRTWGTQCGGTSMVSVCQKASIASVSQRQSIASGSRMRVKRKMPGDESRMSAA